MSQPGQRRGIVSVQDENVEFDSSSNRTRSIPAILGGRKRKAESMEQEMDSLILSSSSVIPGERGNIKIQEESRHVFSHQPIHSQSSSRVPLSTLQNRNSLNSRQNNMPSEPKSFSKLHRPKSTSTTSAPAPKKIKLRAEWSQFREFTQTSDSVGSRSKTPFPELKWADKQDLWDLICKKERGMYAKRSGREIMAKHPSLQPRMRTILVDWLVEVCEVYRQHRETFYLAVDFLDRFLSVTEDMSKNKLQLIGVTSLFIASKIEEIYPPKLSDFAYVTDGACNEDEILAMELVILKKLNWGLAPMTPNAWVQVLMQVVNSDQQPDQNDSFVISKYSGLPFCRIMQLLDLATLDINSLSFTNSVLATAALCHSGDPQAVLTASGYSWAQVKDCFYWLKPMVMAMSEEAPVAPKTFHSIPLEDQHNIQSHSVEISLLDRAQEIALTRCGRVTPEPCLPPSLMDMTPPPETMGNSVPQTSMMVTSMVNSTSSRSNLPKSSVMMTPQTPN